MAGANGLGVLLGQQPLRATRPRHFFRRDGKMPAAVTLQLVLPAELGDSEQLEPSDAIPFPIGTYWLRRFAHVPLGS